ncbi:MAG: hypothetical protein M0027_13910 [Candidatus Dormibacteraeota bacterium]|nr:hypothetical protein [Candidatus Dormibacteraeota bacterium]
MPGEPLVELLDQAQWQQLTTWTAPAPLEQEALGLLTSQDLPTSFQTAVAGSSHTFLRTLRAAAPGKPLERRKGWNNRFANLVSGRFTEIAFSRAYSLAITALGLTLRGTVEKRDWSDYVIEAEGTQPQVATNTDVGVEQFRLAINVKNAGVQFRLAEGFVGMPADDTLPIATYKIFGSSAREDQLPLVYVYLVDWTLLARLRAAYWATLSDPGRKVFQMVTTFKGMPRDLEDSFIEATVGESIDLLIERVGYDAQALEQLPFRAISGARCKAIFYRDHKRSPYVFLQRMNTDPNVHVSVSRETIHFRDFVQEWLKSRERRSDLLAGLRRTATMLVPDPPV